MQEMQETWVQSLGREDPLEEEVAPPPIFLPGKFHGQRSLVDYSPWAHQEWNTTEYTCMHVHIYMAAEWINRSLVINEVM